MVPRKLSAVLGILALVLAACGPAATPTPTVAPALRPTATPVRVAATPTATPPGATPALRPTPTPTKPAEAGPKYGGVLKAVLSQDVDTWELWIQAGAEALDVEGLIHGQLLNLYDKAPGCQSTPLQPGLATSWQWLDSVTVQFRLRQGVKFPNVPPMNGRELTAEDVVYSAQRGWSLTKFGAPVKDQIKRVWAVDKYTVNFELHRPYSPFVERVPANNWAYVIGPEMYGGRERIDRPEDQVGLGPFMFSEYRPGVRIDIRKNKDYWMAGRPYVNEVSFRIMPDLSTVVAALRAGQVDIFWFRGAIPIIDNLKKTTNLGNQVCPHPAAQVIYIKNNQPPFTDVRVRRALSMAIDREALIKTAFLGMATWQYSSVSPHFPDFMLKLEDFPAEVQRYLKYDPAGARKLLAEAGYPSGFDITVNAPPSSYNALMLSIAEALIKPLSDIGLRPTLKVMERATYLSVVYTEHTYRDIAVAFGTTGETLDTEIYDMFHSKSQVRNRAKIVDPVLDEMIERSWTITDPAKYKDLVLQHQVRVADQMYMVYLPHGPISAFWQPYVKNVYYGGISRDNTYLRHVWLDR